MCRKILNKYVENRNEPRKKTHAQNQKEINKMTRAMPELTSNTIRSFTCIHYI